MSFLVKQIVRKEKKIIYFYVQIDGFKNSLNERIQLLLQLYLLGIFRIAHKETFTYLDHFEIYTYAIFADEYSIRLSNASCVVVQLHLLIPSIHFWQH